VPMAPIEPAVSSLETLTGSNIPSTGADVNAADAGHNQWNISQSKSTHLTIQIENNER